MMNPVLCRSHWFMINSLCIFLHFSTVSTDLQERGDNRDISGVTSEIIRRRDTSISVPNPFVKTLKNPYSFWPILCSNLCCKLVKRRHVLLWRWTMITESQLPSIFLNTTCHNWRFWWRNQHHHQVSVEDTSRPAVSMMMEIDRCTESSFPLVRTDTGSCA